MKRTATEWAELFSQSLASTNPLTIAQIIQEAMDDIERDTKQKTLNKVRETLLRGPYYIQPEIVVEIITHVGEMK